MYYYKLLALAAVGSCFELFDFLSFIFLSATLAKVFFPQQDLTQGLIYTFMIFSTGYLFRPIGGVLLAHFGDRYGRKKIFILTLILMSFPSLLIAVLPTTSEIGILAPILLVLARITQGISLGGEVAGATTYVAEFTSAKWRTLACSLITAASNAGVLLVSLVVSLLENHLSQEQMFSYGWRIPFMMGALLGIIAVYLRKRFAETPQFLELQNSRHIEKIPILYILQNYKINVLFGLSIALIVANTTSTFHLFFPSYLNDFMNYKIQDVVLVSSAGIATVAICSPLFALASLYFGRVRQCIAGTILLLILCAFAAKSGYGTRNIPEAYLFMITVSIAISLVNSVSMAILADLFPTCVRFSGVALSYNVGCLLGAGLTPVLNTFLIRATGSLNIPFVLSGFCAAIALMVIMFSAKFALERT